MAPLCTQAIQHQCQFYIDINVSVLMREGGNERRIERDSRTSGERDYAGYPCLPLRVQHFIVDRRNGIAGFCTGRFRRSEEHTSELQSLMRISYAVFCLKKKKTIA